MTGQIKPAPAGDEAQPALAQLLHELTEALTATGNYLTVATRILDTGADPPEASLLQVLERTLNQFSRSIEALGKLRDCIRHIPGYEP